MGVHQGQGYVSKNIRHCYSLGFNNVELLCGLVTSLDKSNCASLSTGPMASVIHTPPGAIQGTPAGQNVDLTTVELDKKLAESEKRVARLTESAKKEKEGELRGLDVC